MHPITVSYPFYFSLCDIVIYNKKYVFGLFSVISGTELLKPLGFPKW